MLLNYFIIKKELSAIPFYLQLSVFLPFDVPSQCAVLHLLVGELRFSSAVLCYKHILNRFCTL